MKLNPIKLLYQGKLKRLKSELKGVPDGMLKANIEEEIKMIEESLKKMQ